MIDLTNNTLYDGLAPIVDWANGYLIYELYAGVNAVDWFNSYLRDTADHIVVDWDEQYLRAGDANNHITVDWTGCFLKRVSTALPTVKWEDFELLNNSSPGRVTANWNECILYDYTTATPIATVAWHDDLLIDNDGETSVRWGAAARELCGVGGDTDVTLNWEAQELYGDWHCNGGTFRATNYQSGDGTNGIELQNETNVTDFDITIKDGLVTSFTKN